jgi:hypothetical protein
LTFGYSWNKFTDYYQSPAKVNKAPGIPVAVPALILILMCFQACVGLLKRQFISPDSIRAEDTLSRVKVHMKDGSLYLLDYLITLKGSDTVSGQGVFYDKYRNANSVKDGAGQLSGFLLHKIPFSDIALIETNRATGIIGPALTITLVGVATAALTIICITDPKACFGSCPTFYSYAGNDTILMAEGFSSSVLPAYEKDDVDHLYFAENDRNSLHVFLKNEAFETHIIRYADLLVCDHPENQFAFASDQNKFYSASSLLSPVVCKSGNINCLDSVLNMDNSEYFSTTSSRNLAEKEYIDLVFNDVPYGRTGLVIGCRQTLLTTWLFYQSLAYLGTNAGHFAAEIESGNEILKKKVDEVWNILGGIEVWAKDDKGSWIKVNEMTETGPLAADVHLLELPDNKSDDLTLRLRMTKGLWRVNYLALAGINGELEPIRIGPSSVLPLPGTVNVSENLLSNYNDPLVTLPGDAYDISYELPEKKAGRTIFLNTRGYYIEWMRDSWIAEENMARAAFFFSYPGLFLRVAAKDFKAAEPYMEELFWNSKYVRKN